MYSCHTSCDLLNAGTYQSELETVVGWLKDNPYDVVTILIVNSDLTTVENFIPAIQDSGLAEYLYTPKYVPQHKDQWPTLGEMILNNDRAVVFMDYNANQTAVTFNTGGVTEFALENPTVALAGSGTARAPYLAIYLNATGRENIVLSFNARDLEVTDNAVQPIAVQYRLSDTGPWIDLPSGYIADATGPSAATLVTPVRVTLPAEANNAATLQLRIMTTDAMGNDEWVGIDDIVVSSAPTAAAPLPVLSINDAIVTEGDAGAATLTYTVQLDRPAGSGGVRFDIATANGTATGGTPSGDYVTTSGTVTLPAGTTTATLTVSVRGDITKEGNETLFVNLSSPVNITIADAQGLGTINNDD